MYAFSALVARMKYIERWGLMRSMHPENLAEHTTETALLCHMLGLISVRIFNRDDVRPEVLASSGLYHDISEILTGDMPTPVKYRDEELRRAYKRLESESVKKLCSLLPPEISAEIYGLSSGECLTEYEKKLLKAADRLTAFLKCSEETEVGNKDFSSALASSKEYLENANLPEVNYFMDNMAGGYSKNLDELTQN